MQFDSYCGWPHSLADATSSLPRSATDSSPPVCAVTAENSAMAVALWLVLSPPLKRQRGNCTQRTREDDGTQERVCRNKCLQLSRVVSRQIQSLSCEQVA